MSDEISHDGLVWTNPDRRGGVPCVYGTRVPLDDVMSLMWDCDDEEINWYYPKVRVDQVRRLRLSFLNEYQQEKK